MQTANKLPQESVLLWSVDSSTIAQHRNYSAHFFLTREKKNQKKNFAPNDPHLKSKDCSSKGCWTNLCKQIQSKHRYMRWFPLSELLIQIFPYMPAEVGIRNSSGQEGRGFSLWQLQSQHLALEWNQIYHELCRTFRFTLAVSHEQRSGSGDRRRDLNSGHTHKSCCYMRLQCC